MIMKVYIAGPYTKGDTGENIGEAISVASSLMDLEGVYPFVPHLNHFIHIYEPRSYDYWMKYDKAWLVQCDAVLRIPGESPGADEEVQLAKSLGIPVYHDLLEFARDLKTNDKGPDFRVL